MMAFGGFGLMMVGMVFFWIVVVALAVGLLSRLFPGATHGAADQGSQLSNTPTSALDILKQRYARGEISRAEYEDIRRGL